MIMSCQNVKILQFIFMEIILTLNLLNVLNGIIHLHLLELSIIIFRDIRMQTGSWSANSIEPGQAAWMCMVTWLYTGGKE